MLSNVHSLSERRSIVRRNEAAVAYGLALSRLHEAKALTEQAHARGIPGLIGTATRLLYDATNAANDAFDALMKAARESI